jgi:SAM-dependent methyltransferase
MNPTTPFDRTAVRRHRDRAARLIDDHDFLLKEIADRAGDRVADVNRRFSRVLCLGGFKAFTELHPPGSFDFLVGSDLSPAMLGRTTGHRVAADEEALPFAPESFDLIVSLLSLHWVNDLPGALIQINRSLKPDGLFLGAMLGGETLHELRRALLAAESETEGGVSPRVSPFVDVRDAGALLQRAGFAMPVVDSDTIMVTYSDPLKLMRDLRGMGESNALNERRQGLSRRMTLARAAAAYHDMFADADGRVPATFQILTLTGWAPHETQPKPLKPGSATTRLAEALGTQEVLVGKTTPSEGNPEALPQSEK